MRASTQSGRGYEDRRGVWFTARKFVFLTHRRQGAAWFEHARPFGHFWATTPRAVETRVTAVRDSRPWRLEPSSYHGCVRKAGKDWGRGEWRGNVPSASAFVYVRKPSVKSASQQGDLSLLASLYESFAESPADCLRLLFCSHEGELPL